MIDDFVFDFPRFGFAQRPGNNLPPDGSTERQVAVPSQEKTSPGR